MNAIKKTKIKYLIDNGLFFADIICPVLMCEVKDI